MIDKLINSRVNIHDEWIELNELGRHRGGKVRRNVICVWLIVRM